jgi:hypothetical protein
MKKGLFIFLVIALLAVFVISCAAKTVTTYTYADSQKDGYIFAAPGAAPGIRTTGAMTTIPAPTTTFTQPPSYDNSTSAGESLYSPDDTDRMIVRTGNMALVVVDIPATITRITQIAGEHQGYVVSSQSWKEGQLLRGTISIRVVASDYDNVVNELSNLAVEVTSQTTSSQDVTEEYIDLTAKLNNLEATEQQLLKVMSQALTVEDILAVQRELTNTRDSIERTKARMQYLERTSGTSLLNIQLEQAALKVDFNAHYVVVKVGRNVPFNSEVAGGFAPYSYEWDLGDGKTSIDANPIHQYKAAGTYTVTLKVTDDRHNTDTRIRKDYITVQPGWSAGNIAGNAWNGLVIFGWGLVNIFIWLGIFSPVWIIGGGIGYWIYRRRKKAGR